MNWVLIYFAIKYKGYFYDIYNALKNKEIVPNEELIKIKNMCENNEIKAITIIDDDYPEMLKKINNPPFVLFYEGNKSLISKKAILFTGEFMNSTIEQFVNNSIKEIKEQYMLISCNQKELDKYVIDKFIEMNGNVIVVSADGINDYYQDKWANDNFLLISEFPNLSILNKKRIHQRNNLALGLSEALIIASSYKKSSIMNLVSYALEQGKDVYCYPGLQTENDGNNLLIQEGAKLITSIKSLN